jgi:hypothetical protein
MKKARVWLNEEAAFLVFNKKTKILMCQIFSKEKSANSQY